MSSDAVGSERISTVVGYKVTKGVFSNNTPNLPQRIAIFGEVNTANQIGLTTAPVEITSAQQAGMLFGFGSPIYHAMRILRPINGSGIGGIPTIVYPSLETGVARKIDMTITGVASKNGTHTVIIAGRSGLDGTNYDVSILVGDTSSMIAQKISDTVNSVLGSPVDAVNTGYDVEFTSKWKGLTSGEITITIDDNGNDLGLTYSTVISQSAAGAPNITASLALIGNDWVTTIVNCYGMNTTIMDALELFNGIPDVTNPTGRYATTVTKPFIALTGSTDDDPSGTTNDRLNDVTVAICPAPGSSGFTFEAAANMAYLFATISQNNPNLDVSGENYPDMPTPTTIGSMADYNNRDLFVKRGCSTVDLVAGKYKVKDFVTTYHPIGENPPQYRYCRNLLIDFNIRFGYYLLEELNVIGHSVANDSDIVSAQKVIKPKIWKGILFGYADNLADRGLISDVGFTKSSITVELSSVNPDRFETFFRYKRSSFVRIASTTVEAGFNSGN
jgi:phage tail sheath gpL-like